MTNLLTDVPGRLFPRQMTGTCYFRQQKNSNFKKRYEFFLRITSTSQCTYVITQETMSSGDMKAQNHIELILSSTATNTENE